MDSANGYLLTVCIHFTSILHETSTFGILRNSSAVGRSQSENTTLLVINTTDDDLTSGGSREQTLTITVASLAVMVAIVVFICVAYKFHALQLDAKRKEVTRQLMGCRYPSQCLVGPPHCPDSPKDSIVTGTQPQPDIEQTVSSTRRKGVRTPTPPLLSPPPSLGSKRGSRCSTWSNLSDQDVFAGPAPRRHNSFIL